MRLIPKILIIVCIVLIVIFATVTGLSQPKEQISPSDTISSDQIQLTNKGIYLNIPDAIIVSYRDTNSMDPLLDYGANGIEIPLTPEIDLNVGDIVSYNASWNDTLISHRIIDINKDEMGVYYTLKGDNNSIEDPEKVRRDQIKYKLIGVLY